MREQIFFIIFAIILITLETTILSFTKYNDIKISLIYILILWLSFNKKIEHLLFTVVIIGFICEVYSISKPFMFVVSFIITYIIIRYILNNVNCTFIWQKILVCFLVTVVAHFIMYLFYGRIDRVIPYALLQAVLNSLVIPILFPLYDNIFYSFFPYYAQTKYDSIND